MDGALKELPSNDNLVFLWNKTMTQQHVDSGVFKRIGVIQPHGMFVSFFRIKKNLNNKRPCFVIAVREDLIANKLEKINTVLNIVNQECKNFLKQDFKTSGEMLQKMYKGLSPSDAKEFLDTVSYNCCNSISKNMLQGVLDTLYDLKLLEVQPKLDKVLPERCYRKRYYKSY